MAISSPISSAANNIVSTNRGAGSVQKVQNNYSGFLRFMEIETRNLQSIQINKKKLNEALSANVATTFGSAGGLLGGLMGGGLDLGGFLGDFFGRRKGQKGRGAVGKAALQEAEESAGKATIAEGTKIRLPGMKGMGVLSALFAGVDFSERLGQGQSVGQAGAGAGAAAVGGLAGMAAGEALAGMIGQALVPIPGLGFVLGAAVGGLAGAGAGYLADRMTGVNKGNQQPELKQKTDVKLKQQEQSQKAQAAGPKVSFPEVVSRFDNVVDLFVMMVKRGFFGELGSSAMQTSSTWDQGEGENDQLDYRPEGGPQAEPTGEGEDVFPLVGGRPQFTTGAGTFNAPRDGGRRIHHAQDIGVDPNTPVVAMRSGTVIDAYSSGYGAAGGAVIVKYDNGQQGLYGHVTPDVKTGDKVKAGQRIAKVVGQGGNTHLHYMRKDTRGTYIDPLPILQKSKSGVSTVTPQKQENKTDLQQQSQFDKNSGDMSQQQQRGQQRATGTVTARPPVVNTPPPQQQIASTQTQQASVDPQDISQILRQAAMPQNIMNVQQISQYPVYNLGQSSVTLIPITQNTGGQAPMVVSSPGGGTQTIVMPGPTEGQVLNSLFKKMLLTSLSAT